MAAIQKDFISSMDKVATFQAPIYSPVEDAAGNLYVTSSNGYIYQLGETEINPLYNMSGQPSGLAFDVEAGLYIADPAHQAILSQGLTEAKAERFGIVKEFEGTPLLGPNSLIINKDGNTLFFTDSGSFGQTSLANPRGSVYMVNLESNSIKPLIHELLAQPHGLALSLDESSLFVAEMCKNRILRLAQHPAGIFHFSTFCQFAGRFGPSALAMHQSNRLFVAQYDFPECSKNGAVSIVNEGSEIEGEILIPDGPEVTGLCFSHINPDLLYVTEKTTNSLYKIIVNLQ
eukprot:TRINITY_DN14098_c0_g1_i3.p1 TRINITY_DN14098_c0_g1~~TRINITY_DN14098_c0_g1_i3.p1  ORF type:complete len:288 (+),score=49.77 TRINITY_DN14098_c0_g1_i3:136-999(+)